MMQEYDDDFFFEEDKMSVRRVQYYKDPKYYTGRMFEDKINTKRGNVNSALALSVDDSALNTMEDTKATGSEGNLPEQTQEQEDADCIFNDLRQERFMIQHQNLM